MKVKKKYIDKVLKEGYSIENDVNVKKLNKVLRACFPKDEDTSEEWKAEYYGMSTLFNVNWTNLDRPKDPTKVIKASKMLKKKVKKGKVEVIHTSYFQYSTKHKAFAWSDTEEGETEIKIERLSDNTNRITAL